MAITVGELKQWLEGIPDEAETGVDDGGLSLVVVGSDEYIEIGGVPKEA